jgi:uncharacterized membrane protein
MKKMYSFIKKSIKISVWLLILFFSWQMIQLSIVYLVPPFRIDIDFLQTKQEIISINMWRYAFYTHISTSLITILCGLTQFSKTFYTKFATAHRTIGKIYVFTLLFLSAPSGFVLACYANGGWQAQTAFILLSVLWFCFTLRAYTAARAGDFVTHLHFMLRSYALTWSAVSLRLLQFAFGFYGFFDYEISYRVAAWGGWCINLLLAEVMIAFGIARYYISR